MTTVIVPGAPRPVPADPQIRLPPPPVWSGIRYREWFRKYSSPQAYKAYKRTRIWRAGGPRHGGGPEDLRNSDYRNYVDPVTDAFSDVARWAYNTTWGIRTGKGPQKGDKADHDWRGRGWLYDGKQWVRNYDKPDWTDHFDWLDANMRTKGDYPNRLKHKWNYKAKMYHERHRNDMPVGYYQPKPRPRRRRTTMRVIRNHQFRPGFFNRDDHY